MRERIAMTPAEILRFLADQCWMVLATLDADGSPWGDTVPCLLAGETLYFAVRRGGRTHANLERDPRACCAQDRFPSYYEIQGVTLHGRARAATDAPAASRLAAPGGAVYCLGLDDVFSFDFAKIRDKH